MEDAQIDAQLCKQCGGRCCQGHPGTWSNPQRFFSIFGGGKPLSCDEFVAIVKQRGLQLRDVGGVLVPAPQENEHGCAAQCSDGCAFSVEERPCQCLALIPQLETLLDDQIHCILPAAYGSATARKNWYSWQELLLQVRVKLQDQRCC